VVLFSGQASRWPSTSSASLQQSSSLSGQARDGWGRGAGISPLKGSGLTGEQVRETRWTQGGEVPGESGGGRQAGGGSYEPALTAAFSAASRPPPKSLQAALPVAGRGHEETWLANFDSLQALRSSNLDGESESEAEGGGRVEAGYIPEIARPGLSDAVRQLEAVRCSRNTNRALTSTGDQNPAVVVRVGGQN